MLILSHLDSHYVDLTVVVKKGLGQDTILL